LQISFIHDLQVLSKTDMLPASHITMYENHF